MRDLNNDTTKTYRFLKKLSNLKSILYNTEDFPLYCFTVVVCGVDRLMSHGENTSQFTVTSNRNTLKRLVTVTFPGLRH